MAASVVRHCFTVQEYHRMAKAGLFTEDDRVELIEGDILEMSPIGSRHAACVKRLIRLLDRRVGERAIVAAQDPIQLGHSSEPQPDVALLKPRSDFYAAHHPGPADALLLVEVSDSRMAYDREVKLPLYARYGIPEVWLVDLEAQVVEVYRMPGPEGYREVRQYRRDMSCAPHFFPDLELAVEAILG